MGKSRKASVLATAALTALALGAQAAPDAPEGKRPSPVVEVDTARPAPVEVRPEARPLRKERVRRVKGARVRPRQVDPDLAMPAGTLYDVISRADVPS